MSETVRRAASFCRLRSREQPPKPIGELQGEWSVNVQHLRFDGRAHAPRGFRRCKPIIAIVIILPIKTNCCAQ